MWALVINPVSGQGRGTTVGTYVAGYLNQHTIDFTIVTGNSSIALSDHLRTFISKNPDCEGVIAVGGDGLMHIALQLVVPSQIPFTIIPAGTGMTAYRNLEIEEGQYPEPQVASNYSDEEFDDEYSIMAARIEQLDGLTQVEGEEI